MTANTVAYGRLLEDRRYHVEDVAEKKRANRAREAIDSAGQQETAKHNRESEAINWFSARNLATLQAQQGQAALTQSAAALSQADTAAGRLEVEAYRLPLYERETAAAEKQAEAAMWGSGAGLIKAGTSGIYTLFSSMGNIKKAASAAGGAIRGAGSAVGRSTRIQRAANEIARAYGRR